MKKILGLDIGGANTKFVLIDEQSKILTSGSEYFPFWKKKSTFPVFLQKIKKEIINNFQKIDFVAFVTTAELADCFETKKEGIEFIANTIIEIFKDSEKEPVIHSTENKFIKASQAKKYWLEVSASNWHISAILLGKKFPNSIFIDIGSTTTDLIPIFNHKVVAEGKTDFDRLASNELIYSGLLRTNIAAFIEKLKVQKKDVAISSELFATTGDIYLILNIINEEDYTVETADRKPATKENAKNRLLRVICADRNQLNDNEIMQIATQVKNKHLEILSNGFTKVLSNYQAKFRINPKIILSGTGASNIGIMILRENGIYEEILLDEMYSKEISAVFPAFAIASLYLEEELKVVKIK